MDTAQKAKELLTEIDRQIADSEKSLKTLRAQRSGITKLVNILGAKAGRPRGMRGRPRGTGKRTRTDWNKVIASFKGAFSIDDLAKASKKSKGTVNQAIQNLKKAGKIKSTGKRGQYQRAGAAAKAAKHKSKAPTRKATAKKVAKKKVTPKQPVSAPAQKQEEGEGNT